MLIYVVRFSETGKPVGNPLHRDPVEAAWHVREHGADRTDVLQITSTDGVCIQDYAQQRRIWGRDFIDLHGAALLERDRREQAQQDGIAIINQSGLAAGEPIPREAPISSPRCR